MSRANSRTVKASPSETQLQLQLDIAWAVKKMRASSVAHVPCAPSMQLAPHIGIMAPRGSRPYRQRMHRRRAVVSEANNLDSGARSRSLGPAASHSHVSRHRLRSSLAQVKQHTMRTPTCDPRASDRSHWSKSKPRFASLLPARCFCLRKCLLRSALGASLLRLLSSALRFRK